ncbi:hypothetical protein ACS0TY_029471 [Phlomoides rotata]
MPEFVPRSRLPALFTTRDRWIPSVDTAGDSSSASSSATLSWWKFAISQRFSSLIHLRSLGLLRPGILRGVSRFYRCRRTRNSVMARQFLFGAHNRSARFSAASPSSSFGLDYELGHYDFKLANFDFMSKTIFPSLELYASKNQKPFPGYYNPQLDSVVQRKAESKKRFSYQGHSPFSPFTDSKRGSVDSDSRYCALVAIGSLELVLFKSVLCRLPHYFFSSLIVFTLQ